MLSIGIDTTTFTVYEGSVASGKLLWPAPVITPACVSLVSDNSEKLLKFGTSNPIFREDYYDPISRIRRGRFYFPEQNFRPSWVIEPHPAAPPRGFRVTRQLDTYAVKSFRNEFMTQGNKQPLVILGSRTCHTFWTVVSVEGLSNGEELVTLKARRSLGALPQIYEDRIPEEYRSGVLESIDKLMDDIYRASPESVIDRAGSTVCHIMIAYLKLTGSSVKDLAKLSSLLEEDGRVIAGNLGKTLARLHARAKPSEREKRKGLPPIREQDAELAIQCVGTIICELGYGEWR